MFYNQERKTIHEKHMFLKGWIVQNKVSNLTSNVNKIFLIRFCLQKFRNTFYIFFFVQKILVFLKYFQTFKNFLSSHLTLFLLLLYTLLQIKIFFWLLYVVRVVFGIKKYTTKIKNDASQISITYALLK